MKKKRILYLAKYDYPTYRYKRGEMTQWTLWIIIVNKNTLLANLIISLVVFLGFHNCCKYC